MGFSVRGTAIITIIAVSATLLSCAKRITEDDDVVEQRALDAWVAKYAPDAVELGDYGIYYETLTPAEPNAQAIELDTWVFMDYTIKDIMGNVVYNRKEEAAKRQGQYNKYARYISDYQAIPPDLSDLTVMHGMYYGLMDMKVGEMRRFYIPSKYGYGGNQMHNSYGYGGQYALGEYAPLILDEIVVNEVIKNPEEREKKMVEELISQWGMSKSDSIKEYLYMQVLKRGAETDTIPMDKDVEFYYTGRFVEDGGVFNTNIDTVWTNSFGELRKYDPVKPITMTRKEEMTSQSIPELTFTFLIPKLRYGDSIRVAAISRYAYHDQGKAGYRTTNISSDSDDYTTALMLKYMYNPYGYGSSGYSDMSGMSYYDYWAQMNYFMSGSTGDNQVTDPMPEVKPFTPVMFTVVVQKPEDKSEEQE